MDVKELEEAVKKLLQDLGCPSRLRGYDYLITALMEVTRRPELCERMVTKQLYPLVAKKNNTNSQCVEKGIRTIIQKMKKECSPEVLERYFGNVTLTNGNVIGKLGEYLRKSSRTEGV